MRCWRSRPEHERAQPNWGEDYSWTWDTPPRRLVKSSLSSSSNLEGVKIMISVTANNSGENIFSRFSGAALSRLPSWSLDATSGPAREAVYVVDPDRAVRESLADLFGSLDVETRGYSDFDSYLSSAPPEAGGCLVLDALAWIAGASRLEERPAGRLPVVAIASRPSVALAVKAIKLGAVDFLEKPFREQRMLEAVADALRKDRALRPTQAARCEIQARLEALTSRER